MKLGDTIIAKTPCCGRTVHLTKTGAERWTRHCTGKGCRNVYDVALDEHGQTVWKKREGQ